MPIYQTPRDDIRFLLHDLLNAGQLAQLPGYADANPETIDTVIDAAGRLC